VRFFTTHGKKKQLTAPTPNGVGHPLSCAGSKTHGKHGLFVVRLPEKRTANMGCLPCASLKNARQTWLFAVHLPEKRMAINGTFAMRLYKCTAKALFWLLVLVTLPCVFRKTHDKVTIAIYFFGFLRLKIPKNHRSIIYIIIFITGIIYIIIFITGIIYVTISITDILYIIIRHHI
jgi:hypothetical protein